GCHQGRRVLGASPGQRAGATCRCDPDVGDRARRGRRTELEFRCRRAHARLQWPGVHRGREPGRCRGELCALGDAGGRCGAHGVPHYLVPRARSLVGAQLLESGQGRTVNVSNRSTAISGTADFYAWGLRGASRTLATGLRAVGVQSFNDPANGQILVFAVNTFGRVSNQVDSVYDVLVDLNGDGVADYDIEAADLGLLTGGSTRGQMVVAVFNLATGAGTLEFLATAPTDGSTVLMPLVAADAGITSANPRFSYVAQSLDLFSGAVDAITTPARFNAFDGSVSTGAYVVLPPGASGGVPLM